MLIERRTKLIVLFLFLIMLSISPRLFYDQFLPSYFSLHHLLKQTSNKGNSHKSRFQINKIDINRLNQHFYLYKRWFIVLFGLTVIIFDRVFDSIQWGIPHLCNWLALITYSLVWICLLYNCFYHTRYFIGKVFWIAKKIYLTPLVIPV